MNWNMPYGILRYSNIGTGDHPTPLSDLTVATPKSQHDPPSPMAIAIQSVNALDRARLYVEGKHFELLVSMDSKQRMYEPS